MTNILLSYGEDVCISLLCDRTTQQNIYWATNSYALSYDKGYSFYDSITLDKITGKGKDSIIRPRALKSLEEKNQRVKEKAEVFTPSWICNVQNNLIDETWFGRKEGLFNSPHPNDPQKWINNEEPITFPNTEGKTWKDYVTDVRLEITCGEAPYLCNRYDATSGEYNENVRYRIGLLDRKLRIVSENTRGSKEWILWAMIALRATYGFEWQGDNLLLAREALFYTFAEHYIDKFGVRKFDSLKMDIMPKVAYIISWNIWQMDGLKFGLPGYNPYVKEENVEPYMPLTYDDGTPILPKKHEILPHERFCLIRDFFDGVNLKKKTLSSRDFNDQSAPKYTFKSIVNKEK